MFNCSPWIGVLTLGRQVADYEHKQSDRQHKRKKMLSSKRNKAIETTGKINLARKAWRKRLPQLFLLLLPAVLSALPPPTNAQLDTSNEYEEQIKAVFSHVAHGSTTKRSVAYDFFDTDSSDADDFRQVYHHHHRPEIEQARFPAFEAATPPPLPIQTARLTTVRLPSLSSSTTTSPTTLPPDLNFRFYDERPGRRPTSDLSPSLRFPSFDTDSDAANQNRYPFDNRFPLDGHLFPSDIKDSQLDLANEEKRAQQHARTTTTALPLNETSFEYGPTNEVTSGFRRILGDPNDRQLDVSSYLENDPAIAPTADTSFSPALASPALTTTPSTTAETATAAATATAAPKSSMTPKPTSVNKTTAAKQPQPTSATASSIDGGTSAVDSGQANRVGAQSPASSSNADSDTSTFRRRDTVWLVSMNVHIYLIVVCNLGVLAFSFYKLLALSEKEQLLFHRKHYLLVHALIVSITLLRLFYLGYDSYNINKSLPGIVQDLLSHLPMSLLAVTFAFLIIFLMKRSLSHLRVTRPIFLVIFALVQSIACLLLIAVKHASAAGDNLSSDSSSSSAASSSTAAVLSDLICRFVFVLVCSSLGVSYLYLYRIIRNVLVGKKGANFSELIAQNVCYAAHYTIAVALLFLLLGIVQLYGLFAVRNDRFDDNYYWIVWAFELSLRLLEVFIMVLIAIIISLRLEQRTHGSSAHASFPMFPCSSATATATNSASDSSTDQICPPSAVAHFDYSLRRSLRYQPHHHHHHPHLPQQQPPSLPQYGTNAHLMHHSMMTAPNSLYGPISSTPTPPIIQQQLAQAIGNFGHASQTEFYKRPNFPSNNNIYSEPMLDATSAMERGGRVRNSNQSASSALTSSSSCASASATARKSLANRKRLAASGAQSSTLLPATHFPSRPLPHSSSSSNSCAALPTYPNDDNRPTSDFPCTDSSAAASMLVVDDNGFVRFKHLNDSGFASNNATVNAAAIQNGNNPNANDSLDDGANTFASNVHQFMARNNTQMASTMGIGRRHHSGNNANRMFNDC